MGNPYAITPPLTANGNINVSSFVKLDTSNDEYVLQAGAGDTPIGVSGSATDNAPGVTGATAYDAIAGEPLIVYPGGSVVQLTVGSAGWTRGNLLKPETTTGYGTPVTSIYDVPGAIALESANAGEYSRVYVLPPVTNLSALPVVAVAVDTTYTARDSRKTVIVTAADKVITLPLASTGLEFTVVVRGSATGGSVGTTVAINAADKMTGNGFTAATGKGAINTQATAADGNWIRVIGNGIDGWNIVGIGGTWARVA